MKTTRTKSFAYKQAHFLQQMDDLSLEQLLKAAIKKSPKPLRRQHNPSGDNETFCLLNYAKDARPASGGHIFGVEMLSYVKGADQSILGIDADADEIPVSFVEASKDQEFLEANLYFGVLKNHVILMQSSALQAKHLEDHLNWFLIEHTAILHEDNRVELHDAVPDDSSTRNMVKGATGIKLTSPVNWSPVEASSGRAEEVRLKPSGQAWNALQAFLPWLDLPDYLSAGNLESKTTLRMELLLKWVRSGNDEDKQDFMAGIARQMRHVEDQVDYSVQTKDGEIGKEKFKIKKGPFQVPWTKGQPAFDFVFPSMLSWLSELAKQGKIQP